MILCEHFYHLCKVLHFRLFSRQVSWSVVSGVQHVFFPNKISTVGVKSPVCGSYRTYWQCSLLLALRIVHLSNVQDSMQYPFSMFAIVNIQYLAISIRMLQNNVRRGSKYVNLCVIVVASVFKIEMKVLFSTVLCIDGFCYCDEKEKLETPKGHEEKKSLKVSSVHRKLSCPHQKLLNKNVQHSIERQDCIAFQSTMFLCGNDISGGVR